MTFPLVFNILREKCDEGAQYKRSPLSIERRITGCKFFPSAFWNIPTGAVFLKSKESRKNRETALSIKRARKRFRESGWYREHSSLSAIADGDFLLYSAISPYPRCKPVCKRGEDLMARPCMSTKRRKSRECECRQESKKREALTIPKRKKKRKKPRCRNRKSAKRDDSVKENY